MANEALRACIAFVRENSLSPTVALATLELEALEKALTAIRVLCQQHDTDLSDEILEILNNGNES